MCALRPRISITQRRMNFKISRYCKIHSAQGPGQVTHVWGKYVKCQGNTAMQRTQLKVHIFHAYNVLNLIFAVLERWRIQH